MDCPKERVTFKASFEIFWLSILDLSLILHLIQFLINIMFIRNYTIQK